MSRIHIRELKADEWGLFKSKRLQALKENNGLFLVRYEDALEKPDEFWQALLELNDGQVFGLFDDSLLIGITSVFTSKYDPSGQTALFAMSFIDSDYRGLGLSRLLYEKRISWAKERGFKKVSVGHREGNEASKAANQKFGFKFVEKEEIDFPDGKRAFDYRYELKIGP